MELKDYEKKIGHSVEEMTYEELLGYLEINQDESIDFNLSYGNAYWLGRYRIDNIITSNEYDTALSNLREAIVLNKRFCRILIEAESPGQRDYTVFYVKDS